MRMYPNSIRHLHKVFESVSDVSGLDIRNRCSCFGVSGPSDGKSDHFHLYLGT